MDRLLFFEGTKKGTKNNLAASFETAKNNNWIKSAINKSIL
jgi:hypothetical protein